MACSQNDTIAAIVTPIATGGLGVVRISGTRAKEIFARLFISSNGVGIHSHRMVHGWLYDSKTKLKVDQILACYMQSPKTYTREDVVELFCHGSVAVLEKALDLVLCKGARLADRGEFTKRAFLNGAVDLAQAESVLDLVGAKTLEGAGYAIQQLDGNLSSQVNNLRSQLIEILAEVECEIDFPEDFPALDYQKLKDRIGGCLQKTDEILAAGVSGRVFRDGFSVVIVGKPNVGKSCLLNALLGEERAIVTNIPGTTRDTIEESLEIKGLLLKLIDTAGLRVPGDVVEEYGIGRTYKEIAAADFVLMVVDGSQDLGPFNMDLIGNTGEKEGIIVINKVDIANRSILNKTGEIFGGQDVFWVSSKTGEGIANLKEGVYNTLRKRFFSQRNALLLNSRHRGCFRKAREALSHAIESCKGEEPVDCISIDLKASVLSLGEVTGELVSEEVINTIFDQFCVGK